MRVVFFGTPALAVPSLAALHEAHDVLAAVCQPDKPKGRGKKLEPPPVKQWAQAHGVPVHQPLKLNDGTFEAWLKDTGAEVCALAAYGRILKQPILDAVPHGFLNMHPSLLPKYRGPSPIQSAVLNGETETGVTTMRVTLEMDSGPILHQERVTIGANETAVELTDRLASLGGRMLAEAVSEVASGRASFVPQMDDAATYCSMLKKEDGFMDWTQSARHLHNLVRGAQPWPSAQTLWRGHVCRVLGSELAEGGGKGQPGEVIATDKDRAVVATGDGALAITAFQPPGKRAMPMADYLRGANVKTGERFASPAALS